jgi:hypothetical protein
MTQISADEQFERLELGEAAVSHEGRQGHEGAEFHWLGLWDLLRLRRGLNFVSLVHFV